MPFSIASETVLILDRGLPVARLEPAWQAKEDGDGRLARLERQGLIRRGTGAVSEPILESVPPRAKKGASVLDALLDEREEGR